MIERILTTIAFLTLTCFLGVLIYKVWRVDLGVVIGLTIAMAFYDLFIHRCFSNKS
jgi:hypothetical protein